MQWSGLSPSVLGMWALACGLTLTILYLLKLRRRQVRVPFLQLWRDARKTRERSLWWSSIKRWLSLLLQLAIMALLLLALAQPEPDGSTEGRHVVLLLDASASMQATDTKPNRFADAAEQALRWIQAKTEEDRMMVVSMAHAPRPLTPMTADSQLLLEATRAAQVQNTGANLTRGLRFAADTLQGLSNPEILLLSDGSFSEEDQRAAQLEIPVRHLPIGRGGPNLAITEFSARRYPLDRGRAEVLLELLNTSDSRSEVELQLKSGGEIVHISKVELPPKGTVRRIFGNLSGAEDTLEALLVPAQSDLLAADNRAFAVLPEKRRTRVHLITSGNTYLEAALLLDEYLDLTVSKPEALPQQQRFQVTICDRVAPTLGPEAGARLYLAPPPSGSPVKLGPTISDFGFDSWDKKSPFLRFMAMENIQVATGHSLLPTKEQRVIGASELGAILVQGSQDQHPFLVLGFDPRDSDFVLRAGWPLFLLNLVNTASADKSDYVPSYRTGEVWQVPIAGEEAVVLRYPSGRAVRSAPRQGFSEVLGTETGVYTVEYADRHQELFAANLVNATESRLSEGQLLPESQRLERLGVEERSQLWPQHPWLWLLAAAMLLSAAEWVFYHRRWTT